MRGEEERVGKSAGEDTCYIEQRIWHMVVLIHKMCVEELIYEQNYYTISS